MADGAPRNPAIGGEAPLRERFVIVDDFLPADLAEAMRGDIDRHFADPHLHKADTHQVWNYWFVPELYAYLRTQPEKVIASERVNQFHERLRAWALVTLGLGVVTWPYLSLYVPGCRQGLHNDSVNGRFGFVYSLTRNERRTLGGETVLHREGDPFRSLRAQAGAGRSFYEMVPPRFNRLLVFDDRVPHAVERLDGAMDPVEGRFVLHGHISEAGPAAAGALSPQAAAALAGETVRAFTQAHFLDGYQGLLTAQVDVRPDGAVGACRLLLDRVTHPDANDRRWPGLAENLLARLADIRFPAADGPTRLLLPIVFGAPMTPR